MNTELFHTPCLTDFLYVCSRLPLDEQEQVEAATGKAIDFDHLASSLYLGSGPRWVLTGREFNTPMAIGGCTQPRAGVWTSWMYVLDEAWQLHARDITRHCRKIMEVLFDQGAHRIECVCLANRHTAHRWYDTLGLEREGTLRAWGARGEDAVMFSRVRK